MRVKRPSIASARTGAEKTQRQCKEVEPVVAASWEYSKFIPTRTALTKCHLRDNSSSSWIGEVPRSSPTLFAGLRRTAYDAYVRRRRGPGWRTQIGSTDFEPVQLNAGLAPPDYKGVRSCGERENPRILQTRRPPPGNRA